LSPELNAAGLGVVEAEGFGDNSPDGTYCSFDDDRMSALFDIMTAVNEAKGVSSVATAAEAYTNEYCDGAPGR
jgi:hypothetical protein